MYRPLAFLGCTLVVTLVAWFSTREEPKADAGPKWTEVAPGVYRSPGIPAGYALVNGDRALLIDAPAPLDGLKAIGVKHIDRVLLTHHHRDSCAQVGPFLDAGLIVQAPKASAPWLLPDDVKKYWQTSIPLRGSRTAYLVVPEGFAKIDCSLEDKQKIEWKGWQIEVVAAPGHSQDHVAYAVRKGKDGDLFLFCGDAISSKGKMPTPYTTDWDHWTEIGLAPAARTLRQLAQLQPAKLLPAHGDVINGGCKDALNETAAAVEDVAFLKSFERFTKERLKKEPQYKFLAKDQAKSNGSLPWTKVSPHLWLTGNTYVLVSKDNSLLVVDPWDPHSAKQIPKLREDEKLGDIEIVLCSHAHFDHYDGIYTITEKHKPKFWTLDIVAAPIAEPNRWRAPFLDARPVKIDQRFKDGEATTWREYTLKFHHFPGQTYYTMAVETNIDGKRCLFTADNFFHQDQFSGTGGWMGLNRSSPSLYAASAQKVLDLKPEWVLAEHGGPFEFNEEDFKRRVEWGKTAEKSAAALCPSGAYQRDWNPHRVHLEPLLQKAKSGATVQATLVVTNPLNKAEKLTATLQGRQIAKTQAWTLDVAAGKTERKQVAIELREKLAPGRYVLILDLHEDTITDGSDAFIVIDIES